MLHFVRTYKNAHYSFCPKFKTSKKSLELIMKIVPPGWLLAQTINLGFRIKNQNMKRSFSINPLVIGTDRLVDPGQSPAFQAVRKARGELTDSRFLDSPACLEVLRKTLQHHFQNQRASAMDQDCAGRTLLSVSLGRRR